MTTSLPNLTQNPAPGVGLVRFCGDILEFTLSLSQPIPGKAWLRTNINRADVQRTEIIDQAESGTPPLARDWRDLPMTQLSPTAYRVAVPILETGFFEAKACFLPEHTHHFVWPPGPNTTVKVEPPHSCSGQSIYSAFVRQFGKNQFSTRAQLDPDAIRQLDEDGYTVIPRSGGFRDLVRELDFIIGTLGFRIIQLLPIHPVPTTYARMGRFGSPFATLDFADVDPSLAEFDQRTTPLDQFIELIDAVHQRQARLFMDIPINHTGWASWLQIHHPDWFARNQDRSFQSPGAWGVTWADLSKLDYSAPELWRYMADIFLFWCRHGVDGFRCDAGYMIPAPVWRYISARVRREFPDTLFMLEGLGGSIHVMEELLTQSNLDWAYSEVFQNYSRQDLERYLPYSIATSKTRGLLVNFAETHDNDRLAAVSQPYAAMRTTLAALTSTAGGFGITNGVEWFADRKIDVHQASPLNWGNTPNMVSLIARLNSLLAQHPCFHARATIELPEGQLHNALVILRHAPDQNQSLLALVNLDHANPTTATWLMPPDRPLPTEMRDLLHDHAVQVARNGNHYSLALKPAETLCLAVHSVDSLQPATTPARPATHSPTQQALRAQALRILCAQPDSIPPDPAALDALAHQMADDPVSFCAHADPFSFPRATRWNWPYDRNRTVPVPCGHRLCIFAPAPFIAEVRDGNAVLHHLESLPASNRHAYFAIVPPMTTRPAHVPGSATHAPDEPHSLELHLSVFEPTGVTHVNAPLLACPDLAEVRVADRFSDRQAKQASAFAICSNSIGAMAQVRAEWGQVASQYDCLLAANLNPSCPDDRRILLTRCRAWIVYRGFSHAIGATALDSFGVDPDGHVHWQLLVPSGMGKFVRIHTTLRFAPATNAITLSFRRLPADPDDDALPDRTPVHLILRPDIEDRSSHSVTKAFVGPEQAWPAALAARQQGFDFTPTPHHQLRVRIRRGRYIHQPEWHYMVAHPIEAGRGLEPNGDLFSPGYTETAIHGGEEVTLTAAVVDPRNAGDETPAFEPDQPGTHHPRQPLRLTDALRTSMRAYIVKRDQSLTVLAGFPWFLDWGRDTLICIRGMIAAGFRNEALDIVGQFARFEKDGTLPNMIRGNDSSNRDTSDAPLWFCVALAELARTERRRKTLLHLDCGGRTLADVALSIGRAYLRGTPNGIRVDPASGLVFSPSHFTWMDTNHPAATPREGYPVEIQALWYATLTFLQALDPAGPWADLATRTSTSIGTLYPMPNAQGLADCLHAHHGQPAAHAVRDDAIRPNQLLAITLGAVQPGPLARSILQACEELLIPGAIRSLSNRPVQYPIPVHRNGTPLNDPHNPFWGHYGGDEDTRRKPAYHNGTAWTWLFPSYPEALYIVHGEPALPTARSILASSAQVLNAGCILHVPEILDGATPHHQRGCGAQAWGVTELYRVAALLSKGTGNAESA